MSRVSLPRKAKTKIGPLFPQPVVVGKAVSPRVKRVAKKPKLSAKPKNDHDPEPVYVNNDDPQDLDFAPKRTGTHDVGKQNHRVNIICQLSNSFTFNQQLEPLAIPRSGLSRQFRALRQLRPLFRIHRWWSALYSNRYRRLILAAPPANDCFNWAVWTTTHMGRGNFILLIIMFR